MTTVTPRRQSRIGCLTRLVLLFVFCGAVVVGVLAVMAPWGFYMGGRFHAIPLWQGWGRLHSNSAGGDYAVYVWFWPDHGKFRQRAYVQGRAMVCTPRGERFNLTLGGGFEKPTGTDLNGKTASLYMFNRTVRHIISGANPRPELELRGRWSNPDLVLDDQSSIQRNFDHNANLYPDGKNRPYLGEVSPVTLREGGKSDFEAACAAVKKSHTERKQPATEEDVKAGRAVFHIPDNRSVAYEFSRPLPLVARTKKDMDLGTVGKQPMPLPKHKQGILPSGTLVEIVQCEIGDTGDVLVGFRYAGGEGICLFDELEIIESKQ